MSDRVALGLPEKRRREGRLLHHTSPAVRIDRNRYRKSDEIEITDTRLIRQIRKSYARVLAHNPPVVKPTLNEYIVLALKLGPREIEQR